MIRVYPDLHVEGDIVEDECGDRYAVEWDEQDARFYLYDPVGEVSEPWDEHYLTVIGNIHEHHELFNIKQEQ